MKIPFVIACVLLVAACCCGVIAQFYTGKTLKEHTQALVKALAAHPGISLSEAELSVIKQASQESRSMGNVYGVVSFALVGCGLLVAFLSRKQWMGRPWTFSILLLLLILYVMLGLIMV
jgi:hypothetical protein